MLVPGYPLIYDYSGQWFLDLRLKKQSKRIDRALGAKQAETR